MNGHFGYVCKVLLDCAGAVALIVPHVSPIGLYGERGKLATVGFAIETATSNLWYWKPVNILTQSNTGIHEIATGGEEGCMSNRTTSITESH
jgi:hypothetical protein